MSRLLLIQGVRPRHNPVWHWFRQRTNNHSSLLNLALLHVSSILLWHNRYGIETINLPTPLTVTASSIKKINWHDSYFTIVSYRNIKEWNPSIKADDQRILNKMHPQLRIRPLPIITVVLNNSLFECREGMDILRKLFLVLRSTLMCAVLCENLNKNEITTYITSTQKVKTDYNIFRHIYCKLCPWGARLRSHYVTLVVNNC